ncbi:MAG: hypothetical protein WC423_16185 [Vulcanimicrobiota bacterium]
MRFHAAILSLLLFTLSVPVIALPGPQAIPMPVVKSSAPSKHGRVLNKKEPGQAVDLHSNLVRGRINIVVFFADW